MASLEDLLAAPVLTVAGRRCRGRDLFAAGIVSGRWTRLEAELLRGIALVRTARADRGAIDDALRAFRVERRLLSGDDFKAWMAPRGLTVADVSDVLERGIRRASEPEGLGHHFDAEPAAAREALAAEGVCTGALREIGLWLADRILAPEGNVPAPASLERAPVPELVLRERQSLAADALSEPSTASAARFAELVAFDEVHAELVAAAATPAAVAARVRERELDWTEFELDELQVQTAGIAAEVTRALADDRASVPDVAERAGVEATRRRVRLDEAPPELRPRLLAAHAGTVIGPTVDDGALLVWLVLERHRPDPADPDVTSRCRAELAAEAVQRRRAGQIEWYDRD